MFDSSHNMNLQMYKYMHTQMYKYMLTALLLMVEISLWISFNVYSQIKQEFTSIIKLLDCFSATIPNDVFKEGKERFYKMLPLMAEYAKAEENSSASLKKLMKKQQEEKLVVLCKWCIIQHEVHVIWVFYYLK